MKYTRINWDVMKNVMLFFNRLLFAVCCLFAFVACNDDDDEMTAGKLLGSWDYDVCYFSIDYAEDKLVLPEGLTLANFIPELADGIGASIGKLTAVPIDQLSLVVLSKLNGEILKYFQGIEFVSETELVLYLKHEGKVVNYPMTYTLNKNTIVLNGKELTLPVEGISLPEHFELNYFFEQDKLTLYMSKTVMQQIFPPQLIVDGLSNKVSEAYICDVFNKIEDLRIGVVMK